MLTWLCSIFAEKAQQAQLITILITAAMAIVVVLLNQYFLTKRARKEIYIKKIEEFHSLIIEYEVAGNRFIYAKSNNDYEGLKQHGETVDNAIVKMSMIIELYFPSVSFKESDYRSVFDSHHELNYDEAGDELKNSAKSLKDKSKKLMRKNKH
ncbi:hypothetical protein NQU47_18320 [Pseudoalteromonas distincta]|uniref:hypothetical protein n=1 Tax=Pseudoalteromonas distincta TaxID=77608 RepID=UPI00233FC40E|nr:hypothetical protein [Pseudoalteromonas distincta]MDC3214522.1 hypothetical protein [Pseudoalteromonas distincta]